MAADGVHWFLLLLAGFQAMAFGKHHSVCCRVGALYTKAQSDFIAF